MLRQIIRNLLVAQGKKTTQNYQDFHQIHNSSELRILVNPQEIASVSSNISKKSVTIAIGAEQTAV